LDDVSLGGVGEEVKGCVLLKQRERQMRETQGVERGGGAQTKI